MPPRAAYDDIADWYEHEFLSGPNSETEKWAADPIGVSAAIETLLGSDGGPCLEVGCGTGVYSVWLRRSGWLPVGIDLSGGMLAYAKPRLAVAQGDATCLPIATASVGTALGVMVHTDMPDYPMVLAEVARVLRHGGVYVHIGVHPCFCGGFADRADPDAVVIRPGYLDGHWTKASWTDRGVRDKVGATHFPLPDLMHAFIDAGLVLERFAEGGGPCPVVLALRVRKGSST